MRSRMNINAIIWRSASVPLANSAQAPHREYLGESWVLKAANKSKRSGRSFLVWESTQFCIHKTRRRVKSTSGDKMPGFR